MKALTLFAVGVAVAAAGGCTMDVEVIESDDPFWEEEYTHDDIGEEDEVTTLLAPSQDVWTAATTGACSTVVVRGLSEQLVEEIECMRPGTMARLDGPGVSIGSSVFPYLQKPAADALEAVAASRPMTINSALRTTVQQFVLYTWYRRGRCTHVVSLAAPPGRSNHEAGLAFDTSQYAAARSALQSRGFRWLGSSDPVHFDYTAGGIDLRYQSVLAFQRLWNRNNPGARIGEDGAWGPATEAKMKLAPSAGFPTGAACTTPVGGSLALGVSWQRLSDGSYSLTASGDASVARVEYWMDDLEIGEAPRGTAAQYADLYRFNVERTERTLEVRGFDAAGALVGSGVALMDTVPGTAVYIRQAGKRLYEIGLERADPAVASIEVRVDGFLLTDATSGTTRSTRGAVRSMFNQVGARSFEITTYNADGSLRGTLRRSFTLQ